MRFKHGLFWKLIGSIRLIRPINSAMMGFAVLVGELLANQGWLGVQEVVLGFSVGFILTGGTMAINDYYDLEIDIINEPNRPIPLGQVGRREAFGIGVAFVLLGIFLSVLPNLYTLAIAFLAVVLMVYYNTVGKQTGFFGNIIVSVCVSLPFIYGGFVVDGSSFGVLIPFSVIAFLSNTGREVAKGIVDLEGDKKMGIRTVALKYGVGVASRLSAIFFTSAIILSFTPVLLRLVSLLYLPVVIAADIGFAWSSISIIHYPSTKNARKVKNFTLIGMLLGLLAFIIGSL